MKELKVKRWVIDKAQNSATQFNTFIDYSRRGEDGRPLEEDGCVFVIVEEVLAETEKALQVRLSSGAVLGSFNGWKLWIPKSQIVKN